KEHVRRPQGPGRGAGRPRPHTQDNDREPAPPAHGTSPRTRGSDQPAPNALAGAGVVSYHGPNAGARVPLTAIPSPRCPMVGPAFSLELLRGSRRGRQHVFRWVYGGWLLAQFSVFALLYLTRSFGEGVLTPRGWVGNPSPLSALTGWFLALLAVQ